MRVENWKAANGGVLKVRREESADIMRCARFCLVCEQAKTPGVIFCFACMSRLPRFLAVQWHCEPHDPSIDVILATYNWLCVHGYERRPVARKGASCQG
jgi:hypothetical protein